MCLRQVLRSTIYFVWILSLTESLVPLATLVSATRPPAKTQNVILSPEGIKRYFVTHGGLFSKDGITLDEIRQISRIGRQPGTEGLMCTFRSSS
jgi:serine/threonine-protein phosphatase 5